MVMGLKPKIRFASSMFPLSLTGCFYWILGGFWLRKSMQIKIDFNTKNHANIPFKYDIEKNKVD